MYSTLNFQQFPESTVYYAYFKDVPVEKIADIKKLIISGDDNYDYCYLSIKHMISLEVLSQATHKALLNQKHNTMKANTLNAEIILNLSPINNIMDALKKFGIDDLELSVLVLSVQKKDSDLDSLHNKISLQFDSLKDHSIELTDDLLYDQLDIQKFKKVYKLNDAKFDEDTLRHQLIRLAIGACILRGF